MARAEREPGGGGRRAHRQLGAWGTYCADIAAGMRAHYGFGDDACGFFDFFATPLPDDQAVAVVQAGLDTGTLDPDAARRYARLFQSYELMFWNTLADAD